jgi:peptidoglycan-N-acetylglucosamine deacetylase
MSVPARVSTPARAAPVGLALTFADGPDPRGTPALLDALQQVGAQATFFVIAPNAERHPDLVCRAAENGHRVELHCDRHVRHTELGQAAIRRDTERALHRLHRLGIAPTLWRVPWGVQTPASETIAEELGLTLVGWDVDTHDWRGDSAEAMFESTRAQLTDRAVVLAHDGIGPGARREDCAATVAYVTLVAEHAADSDLDMIGL